MSERIVVTGGTGYVGRALVKRLAPVRDVVVLSRGRALPDELAALGSVRAVTWDAANDGEWSTEVDGAHAVVHLAGAQAVGLRYTKAVKRRLFDSRVKSAEALVRAIERANRRPRVLVSASGVDYYAGGLTDEPIDESAPPGSGFLSELCVAWEGASRAAEALGVRVVCARSGVVVGRGGGGLGTMALPFRFFVGGPLGT
ncbi:MAG TPA: NAD-dependent epimerase/dehydratase family protein, partial [Polyangiaceae bacterium]